MKRFLLISLTNVGFFALPCSERRRKKISGTNHFALTLFYILAIFQFFGGMTVDAQTAQVSVPVTFSGTVPSSSGVKVISIPMNLNSPQTNQLTPLTSYINGNIGQATSIVLVLDTGKAILSGDWTPAATSPQYLWDHPIGSAFGIGFNSTIPSYGLVDAVASGARFEVDPPVPLVAESGVPPGIPTPSFSANFSFNKPLFVPVSSQLTLTMEASAESLGYNYMPYVAGSWSFTVTGNYVINYIPNTGCKVNLPVTYLQLLNPAPPGGPWGSKPYDSIPYTIAARGCATTCLSMALNYAGVTTINGQPNDPGTLNQFMTNHLPWPTYEFFPPIPLQPSTGNVVWDATVQALNPFLRFDAFEGFRDSIQNPDAAYETLDHFLCNAYPNAYPVIVGVKSLKTGKFPGHYVLVYAKVDRPDGSLPAKYLIVDPANAKQSLDEYGHFQTRGAVVPITAFPKTATTSVAVATSLTIASGDDLSSVSIDVDTRANLLVIGPTGLRTGFDPTTGTRPQDIPQSAHFEDAIDDDATGEPATDVAHLVQILGPPQGLYQVVVTGLELGTYALAIRPFSQNGSAQSIVALLGIAAPGTTATYQLQLATIPGGTSQLNLVASFQGTLADIANGLQLGLIDNQGIANSLSQKIQHAQSAATQGDTKTATNVLGAFKNELNAQTGKHVQVEAATVLLQDADSLLSQYP
jgi:hypothetical protein